jgi:hypothetical protein
VTPDERAAPAARAGRTALARRRPGAALATGYGSTVVTYFGAFFSTPMITADFTGL